MLKSGAKHSKSTKAVKAVASSDTIKTKKAGSTSTQKKQYMPSLAEFRSKIHIKGKPLSHIVNEGRR